MKMVVTALAVMVAFPAHAINVPEKPPKTISNPLTIDVDTNAKAAAEAHAGAVAISGQQQGQQQSQNQVATGGQATATGGDSLAVAAGGQGGDAASQSDSSAYSGGNEMIVQTTYRQVRQAPPISQGALLVGQCGGGLNGGGSTTGGAAFLGVAWTPRECHKYLTAANWAAIGMYSMACAILSTTERTKEAVRDGIIEMPSCDFHEKTVTVEEVRYVTPEELAASERRLREEHDRMWRASQGETK